MSNGDRTDEGRSETRGEDISIRELAPGTIERIEGTSRYREHGHSGPSTSGSGGSRVPHQDGTDSNQPHGGHDNGPSDPQPLTSHPVERETHQDPTREAPQHVFAGTSRSMDPHLHADYSGSVFESNLADDMGGILLAAIGCLLPPFEPGDGSSTERVFKWYLKQFDIHQRQEASREEEGRAQLQGDSMEAEVGQSHERQPEKKI
ncbi:hypothetical protein BDQ17DRAFT_1545485 [Cyathus striatus]|nr:hypothetical protein BDQ17DRAFT_1545485 [Cyathus striatus]